MAEGSIVIKAEDKYSSQVKAMASTTRAFDKDVEGLERQLRHLDKAQDALSTKISKTKKTINELQKEFDKTGDAAVELKLETERFNLHTMTRELDLTRKAVKETEKDIRDMADTTKRAGFGGQGSGGMADIMKAFAASGIGNMVGDFAQQLGIAYVSSAFGSDAGSIFSSGLSSGVTGAAMGFAMGGIPGALLGFAGGALAGALTGNLAVDQKKDEYFKSYYNGIIDEQARRRASDIQTGSSIAAGREKDKVSFTTLFGNNEAVADKYLKDLVVMANTTPFLYDDLTAMSKTLATYGYGANSILPALTKIGDAGAALGMGQKRARQIKRICLALFRLVS